jgi:hypothetical protein
MAQFRLKKPLPVKFSTPGHRGCGKGRGCQARPLSGNGYKVAMFHGMIEEELHKVIGR